jgi:catechol 2,3-dioxygenase-like lactoylglutathione lyase family enzyme
MSGSPIGGKIRQVAYFVQDAERSARKHHAIHGSGPFFIVPNIPLSMCLHYGEPARFDHTSAYGQWGDVMIEFVQQNSAEPSCFTDLYPDGRQGFHHVAVFVDDLPAAMRGFEEKGHSAALYAEVPAGQAFAMMDCVADLGHFVELYEPTEGLLGFYAHVRESAFGWNGTDPVRSFSF